MHRTRDSSSVGVHNYKRITDSLKEKTSNVLNASTPPTKKEKLDDSEVPSPTFLEKETSQWDLLVSILLEQQTSLLILIVKTHLTV